MKSTHRDKGLLWPLSDASVLPGGADADGPHPEDPAVELSAARDLLRSALRILDRHARSPAAAHVDLAIHLVEAEIAA